MDKFKSRWLTRAKYDQVPRRRECVFGCRRCGVSLMNFLYAINDSNPRPRGGARLFFQGT